MKVCRDLNKFKAINPVVTIGMFDGVHLGHLSVLEQLKANAVKAGGESVVLTFWPHPRLVLSKEKDLKYLSTLENKADLIGNAGIDHLVVIPFTKEFAKIPSCQFIKEYLVDKLNVHNLVIGYNHQLGKNRDGDYDTLSECANLYGFDVSQLNAYTYEGGKVSSSEIRRYLLEGEAIKANKLLSYEYSVGGTVVGGKNIGEKIGFPTANIKPFDDHKLIPAGGVYAVRVFLLGKEYKGMLNIGNRPTVNTDESDITIEVNIFNFAEDIYKKEIKVSFVKKIRDEMCFPEVDDLIKQLNIDREDCKSVFN